MTDVHIEHRLAAIFAADVVGYSRLMNADETGTFVRWQALLREVIEPAITQFGGRTFKNTGDGVLAEFPSAIDTVQCAIEVQETLAQHNDNGNVPEDQRIQLRIGINLGDESSRGMTFSVRE